MCAWEVGQSLPEFEDRPEEQQTWLLAAWRTRQKLERVRAVDSHRKVRRKKPVAEVDENA